MPVLTSSVRLCLLLTWLCFAAVSSQSPSLPVPLTIATNSSSTLLSIAGDNSTFGISDPSITAFPGGLALSYSSVFNSAGVHTRVAVSTDQGRTFTHITDVNEVSPVTIGCSSGTCSGFLVHEVSSLLYDASERDPQQLWKLFAHSYLVQEPGDVLQYTLGFISLYTAPALSGPWNETRRLGWLSSSSNFSSASATQILNTLDGLTDCIAFTEPGALLQQSSSAPLLLVLGCVYPYDGLPLIRQVLLSSADHAVSFTVLNPNFVPANTGLLLGFDSPQMDGGDLFSISGLGLFLLTSPSNLTASGVMGYLGCLLYAFDSNSTLDLSAPLAWIVAADLTFSGACTFAAGAVNGVMMGRLNRFAPVPFEIRQSGSVPVQLQSPPAVSGSSAVGSSSTASSGSASISSSSSDGLQSSARSSSSVSTGALSSRPLGTLATASSSSSGSSSSIASGIKTSASASEAVVYYSTWLLLLLLSFSTIVDAVL